MSSLALAAGLDPRRVLDLDDDELDALVAAVEERAQHDAWNNIHEVIAAAVEALWAIISRLDAGLPVVQVAERSEKPTDYGRYPRPAWVTTSDESRGESEDGVLVATSLRDVVALMKGGERDV